MGSFIPSSSAGGLWIWGWGWGWRGQQKDCTVLHLGGVRTVKKTYEVRSTRLQQRSSMEQKKNRPKKKERGVGIVFQMS